jgi:hypothetical protein
VIWSMPLEPFDLAFYRSTTLVTHVNVLAKRGARASRNLLTKLDP